jgi:hypothetical protein
MTGAARAVRIPRERELPMGSIDRPAPTMDRPPAAPSTRRFTNGAGSARAFRTFLLFLVALAMIYAVFMGYAVSSSVAGTNSAVEGVLTASVAVALLVGWWVTLGQAPTLAWVEDGELVVLGRLGRIRRFPIDTLRVHVMRSNGVGFLGPDPTEFVEVSLPGGLRRTYLVGAHFFDFAH